MNVNKVLVQKWISYPVKMNKISGVGKLGFNWCRAIFGLWPFGSWLQKEVIVAAGETIGQI